MEKNSIIANTSLKNMSQTLKNDEIYLKVWILPPQTMYLLLFNMHLIFSMYASHFFKLWYSKIWLGQGAPGLQKPRLE